MNYFKLSEFDSPDKPGSGDDMDEEFLEMIDFARQISDTSYRINSGYRTPAHNKKVGGKTGSSHTKYCAADIHAADSVKRFKVLKGLIKAGFTRIGIGKTFIHVDSDKDKSPNVVWTYYK